MLKFMLTEHIEDAQVKLDRELVYTTAAAAALLVAFVQGSRV